MGSNKHYAEEAPAHAVTVDGFCMDMHTVTNSDFAQFATLTGYVTIAERRLLDSRVVSERFLSSPAGASCHFAELPI